jgi:glycosyltransferase involved in cell wall biosynthesis
MIKLLAICEAFRYPASHKRWQILAEQNKDIDITLIAPKKYIDTTWLPVIKTFNTEKVNEERFRVIPVDMKKYKLLRGGWLSYELLKVIIKIKPEFIYLIGFETNNMVYPISLTRRLLYKNSKIVSFTMRGLDLPLHKFRFRFRWRFSKRIFDAIFCHYPQGKKVIKEQGNYTKPIYLQTQVGVDSDIFKPDEEKRIQIRDQYNLNSKFVFGTASRIEQSKGIFDLINALPPANDNWCLLMLGDGKEMEKLKAAISEKGYEKNIILTGFVTQGEDVAAHMNAMDCFIHVPKTTKTWIDTFPLAVVQAMATGLPVIGSDSGAVPYQLGNDGIIVPEGNINALRNELISCLKNKNNIKEVGIKLQMRVQSSFEIKHLASCFNTTMREIIKNKYIPEHIDQVNFVV